MALEVPGKAKNALRSLLKYTQELLSVDEKVTLDLAGEPYPHFHEFQVGRLEGVRAAPDDETWLRIDRLRENPPPAWDPMFEGWADFGTRPSPDRPPALRSERLLRLPLEEVSDLVEAGLVIDTEDVMRPVASGDPPADEIDVILRTANMPEFVELYQEYVGGPWAEWVERERPRRQSIEFYNKVYQIHQRMIALGDDTPIELVFGVGVARWQTGDHRVNVPLIEQLVEVELDEDGALLVQPRNLPPQLALKAFHALDVEGSRAVQREVGELLERTFEDPDVGFSPFDKRSFEKVLRACVARLSPKGVYHPDTVSDLDDRTLPAADESLRVTDTWLLYVRQRSGDFRRDDIERLIRRVEEVEHDDELPAPAVRFLVEPSAERAVHPDDGGIDLTQTTLVLPDSETGSRPPTSGDARGADPGAEREDQTLFFPLPFNEEQREIIRRLEEKTSDGIVVQGPPGTGKTHTIANIISHFLATRRRVLVTAKTPEALTALQEKIPEGIRDLAISVIHSDREGARQLEHAIRLLADEAKAVDVRAVGGQIKEKQARLAALRASVERLDEQIRELAERNLARLVFRSQNVSAMELARLVAEERGKHLWFQDEVSLDVAHESKFGDADIKEARALRRALSKDLTYDMDTLPEPKGLPELARVIAAHAELGRLSEIETAAQVGKIPYMAPDLGMARRLRDWILAFRSLMAEVSREPWLLDAYHALTGLKPLDPAPLAALKEALASWAELHHWGRAFELRAILCDHQDDPAFDKALEDLAAGRRPFGVFSMFKAGLRARIDRCQIEGRRPTSAEEWSVVRGCRMWQQEAQHFLGQWGGVARATNLPILPLEWGAGRDELLRLGRLIERLHGLHGDIDVYRQTIRALFPYGIDADEVLQHGRCELLIQALDANLEKAELAAAVGLRSELQGLAGKSELPFYAALRDFCANLGDKGVSQGAIAEAWQEIVLEARRLDGLKDSLHRLNEITGNICSSGAPNWARQLRAARPADDADVWTPAEWRRTWEWARAAGYLRSLPDQQALTEISSRRASLQAEQRRLFAEVVRLRTFLGLKRSMTEAVDAALAKYTWAIAKLGKGTGKTAGRYRREIRQAATGASRAVPCWILPEWRVAEQLPAELGSFDLVIIDEASQSEITAFPVILRGKKVLIVGDDKQVSPTPIGIEDRKLLQLRTTFLAGIPFANQMDPATSLYELAGMVYPGKAIVLREHFRCVEPIISFSSRFYPLPLIPLRLPKASERLDPPLLDMYVPFGRKVREVNEAEVDVIVAEIAKMVADPAYEGRSIGVVSLIGNAQANRIYSRLITELGAEAIEKHRIMCGNAAAFQGQERDIVFLSMVACPETAVAQTARLFEQRFNVAASRARDRLILVRSVASSDLKPRDLKFALIEHFRDPMKRGKVARPKGVLDVCQSDFERDFGRRLLDLGYRIRPQVEVAGYHIDFVVEGSSDRRLAIELDGDQYHGPEKWADDIRRQRALERLGWVFWRCWGSAWEADRDTCLADLRRALERLGIEPIGSGEVGGAFTSHSEIPPPTPAEISPVLMEERAFYPAIRRPGIVLPRVGEISLARASSPIAAHADAAKPAVPGAVFADLGGVSVEIGDLVLVRYSDKPDRPFSIRLSDTISKPEEGVIHVRSPLGSAILGASVDDHVDVVGGGKPHTAVVEKIVKARELRQSAHP